jgi:plastocyanin
MTTRELRHLWHQAVLVLALLLSPAAVATVLSVGMLTVELRISQHLFNPSTIHVPAGQKVKLLIYNDDPSPEEFESFAMNREKVVLGLSTGIVFLGPLAPGTYPFSGEYNPDSARGQVIALDAAAWAQYLQQQAQAQSAAQAARPEVPDAD